MEENVKNAVGELLEKIPEENLEKAVGGLDDRTKKILAGAGILALGVGTGVAGTFGVQALMNRNKKDEPGKKPGPETPVTTAFAFKLTNGAQAYTPEMLAEQAKDKKPEEIIAALTAGNIPFEFKEGKFVAKPAPAAPEK